jgi:tripartite-type tricarboxylate transporter receptor subunit TctC
MSTRIKIWTGSIICCVFSILVLFDGMSLALAEQYPKAPITMVIPYPPGGGSDMLTRILDKYSKNEFGHNFIFQYKSGAGGAVGAAAISKSKPDGYTIGTVNTPNTVLHQLTGAGDFTVESFDYIAQVASTVLLLVTPGPSKIKTLDQFIAAAKESPGKLTLGIPGAMGPEYIAALKLMEGLNVKVTIVPQKGGADLLASLLGNHLDCALHNDVIIAPEKEKMNLIAIGSLKKHPYFTNVTTFKEKGYDFNFVTGRIYVGPKGIDPEQLSRLRKGFEAIWKLPEYQEDLKKANFDPDWAPGDKVMKDLLDYNAEAAELLKKYGVIK